MKVVKRPLIRRGNRSLVLMETGRSVEADSCLRDEGVTWMLLALLDQTQQLRVAFLALFLGPPIPAAPLIQRRHVRSRN